MRVGELDHGGEAGEGEHVGLGRAVVAAAGDRPARGDQVRVVGEGQGDLPAVTVAAQVGAGLAVLLLAPVLRVLAGALAGVLASSGFQLVRACRAGQVVVADPGGGELAAVLAQHVPGGQRRVIGPQRRGHLGQDVTEPRVGGVESLRVVRLRVVADGGDDADGLLQRRHGVISGGTGSRGLLADDDAAHLSPPRSRRRRVSASGSGPGSFIRACSRCTPPSPKYGTEITVT